VFWLQLAKAENNNCFQGKIFRLEDVEQLPSSISKSTSVQRSLVVDGTWDVNVIHILCVMVLLVGVGFLFTAYQSRT